MRVQISSLAGRDTNVMIYGETGTGKEVAARALHSISECSMQPFVAVNSSLVDEPGTGISLFGSADCPSIFDRAKEGILFLDNVEGLSEQVQTRLLRVLEDRKYRTSTQENYHFVRCRVLSSASPSLDKALADGRFRDDLFYRLRSDFVTLPALRNRKGDCAMLFEQFARNAAEEAGQPLQRLSPETLVWVMSQPWPGNIRELKDTAIRWAIQFNGIDDNSNQHHEQSLGDQVKAFERSVILSALNLNQFDIRRTAESLKTPRKTLTDKMAKYGLQKPE